MEIIVLDGLASVSDEPIVSAIGFFDGMHLGHQKLIEEVVSIGDKKHYKKALMTFDHYPLYIIGKADKEYYLTSMQDRQEILEKLGFDYLFIIPFTKDIAKISYQEFIDHYLIDLNIKAVVCGFDFRFGSLNQGDCFRLRDYDPEHLRVSIIDEVSYDGRKVSSTRIKEQLQQGHMEYVSQLLGRDYCITGKVIEGRHIGHTLGFPTANVDYSHYFLPQGGVYAVKVSINHKLYLGMCNIGYNPTVGALDNKSLEVFIFDFEGDLYGQTISLMFLKKIRDERQFDGVEELVKQLNKDKESILSEFSEV